MHNEDNRSIIKLRTGAHEAEVQVSFDPGDLNTLRVHNANFIAGELVESELSRSRIPPWIYPVGGFLALGVIAVLLEKRRKKKIRQKKYGSTEKAASGKQKSLSSLDYTCICKFVFVFNSEEQCIRTKHGRPKKNNKTSNHRR